MKTSKQCPKCQSLRIGLIETQIDKSGEYSHSQERVVGEVMEPGLLWGENAAQIGELEALVCSDCGYFESYVKDPGAVPWDKLIDFRWINAEPPEGMGPFR